MTLGKKWNVSMKKKLLMVSSWVVHSPRGVFASNDLKRFLMVSTLFDESYFILWGSFANSIIVGSIRNNVKIVILPYNGRVRGSVAKHIFSFVRRIILMLTIMLFIIKKVSIVEMEDPFIPGIAGLFAKMLFRSRLCLFVRGDIVKSYSANRSHAKLIKIFSKIISGFNDIVFTISDVILSVCSNLIPHRYRIKTVIYHDEIDDAFLDNSLQHEASKELKNEFTIVYIGRLAYEKGVDLLPPIIKKVSEIIPDAKFLIVGDGPLKEYFIKRLKTLGLLNTKAFYVGSVSSEQVKSVMAQSDIIILPSRTEGLPRTIREAIALGKPFISFDVGCIKEFLVSIGLEPSAFIVENNNIEGFINLLLKHYNHRTQINRLHRSRLKMLQKAHRSKYFLVYKVLLDTKLR